MSLNIISLSGLILALGMMIDSSIIVTENIAQYRAKGDNLEEACIKGTTEVITPMLSSTFTTIAVFVPLVFKWYSGSDFLRSGVCCYGWFNGLLFHRNHVTACTLQISLQHTGDQAFLFQSENKQFDQGAYARPIL